MEYALEIKGIDKRYRDRDVLRGLNMQVQAGKVYGFLGRNGAGKTTTIRIIMGLVKPDAGSVWIWGKNIMDNRAAAMHSIGAIVESPAFYPNVSGRDNLRISADLYSTRHSRIDEVLKIVDMQKDASRKVKTYSTGMKQRLGIANALLHEPKILILDEPTNGLDPNGVKDLRLLIRILSQKLDITILVSSHILSEIQQVADTVGILHRGELADAFDMEALNTEEQNGLLLEVAQADQAMAILKELGLRYTAVSDTQLKVLCTKAQSAEINMKLATGGVDVLRMNALTDSLEDRFFAVAGNGSGESEV